MKQFAYTIRYLLRGRRHNLIKIVSLTLGFAVGLVLVAYAAFEMSYDTFYKDADQLYFIKSHVTKDGNSYDYFRINAPFPEALRHDVPEVECATVVHRSGEQSFFFGEKKYTPTAVFADSLFFRTMGIEVIKGDEKELGISDRLFISDEYARLIFDEEDPVGKQLMHGKKQPYTIAGVYRALPENVEMDHDVVCSFANMKTQFGRSCDWCSDMTYWGYVRFRQGTNLAVVEQKLPAVVSNYISKEKMDEAGVENRYFFTPITSFYIEANGLEFIVFIISGLAFAILFTMAMNYVLISMSSLAVRAKIVGIHKCSGASDGNIFRMFLYETLVLFAVSLVCVALLLLAFHRQIENMTLISLKSLFAWSNLWMPLLAVLLTCLLVVIIPGRIFSRIPVTQVFRTYTSGRRGWKRVLLFVQFCGIAFIFSLLAVVLYQYDHLMNRDLGYDPAGVVYAQLKGVDTKEKYATLTAELNGFPYVKSIGLSERNIANGYGVRQIFDKDENHLFNSYFTHYDPTYPNVMGLDFISGRTVEGSGELIVNQWFVEKMNWDIHEAPGQPVYVQGELLGTVVGVVNNFNVMLHVYSYERGPLVAGGGEFIPNGVLTLRLSSLTGDHIRELDAMLQKLYPNEDISFEILTDRINESSMYVKSFRDGVMMASIVVFLIALMGLFGYIDDEISRRSKEIAIRKINGATVAGVLKLFSKNMAYIAVPAIVPGVLCSSFAGTAWLQQFADKVMLNAPLFVLCSLLLFLIVILCVLYKSWIIANENPVNSIKTE